MNSWRPGCLTYYPVCSSNRLLIGLPFLKCIQPPALAAKVILGPTVASRRRTVKAILDPLNSPACNTHLLILILDLILATIFPELVQSAAQSATPEKDPSKETDRWPSPTNGTFSVDDEDSIMGDGPHTKERERSEVSD